MAKIRRRTSATRALRYNSANAPRLLVNVTGSVPKKSFRGVHARQRGQPKPGGRRKKSRQ